MFKGKTIKFEKYYFKKRLEKEEEKIKNGFKFPDIKTAFEFSIEHKSEGYNEVPFGFHGFPFTKIGMESKIKILEWQKIKQDKI